jgi:hypothetical protein
MLGTDRSRGYCLEMIWADFPASGAANSAFLRLAGCLGFAERGWPEKWLNVSQREEENR